VATNKSGILTRIPIEQNQPGVYCYFHSALCSPSDYDSSATATKITDADPWFAVVENLIQTRLARFNLNNIEHYAIKLSLRDHNLQSARGGAWGLVLAPRKYFDQNSTRFEATLKLIQELKERTRARIILAATDDLKEGRLK
jgi:hypothetical protein